MNGEWKRRIPVSFGEIDKCFSLHEDEKCEALKLLNEAIQERVGFAEYCKTIRAWLVGQYSKAVLKEPEIKKHIEKQMRLVRATKHYFLDD